MNIIDNIIKIMESKGITAYKLEQETGIKQTLFIAWKKGSQPSIDKIDKLIKYFEVTPNELLGYEPITVLDENAKEMLTLFQRLPGREQLKYIARLEDAVEALEREGKLSNSKIG